MSVTATAYASLAGINAAKQPKYVNSMHSCRFVATEIHERCGIVAGSGNSQSRERRMTPQPGSTIRHALMDEEQRLPARTDANTFRLQLQFMRAHGASSGQLTTLVTSLEGGTVWSSAQRRQ
jgi:hypothetical protein